MGDKKEKVEEFRYYEMPIGRYDLALLGDCWISTYRTGEQHFHNYFEISYCYYGSGVIYMGEDRPAYEDGTITLIPSNFPHGIHSAEGSVCKWEFLYVDLAGFIEKCYGDNPNYKLKILQDIMREPLVVSEKEYPGLARAVRGILEENREQKQLNREAVFGYMYVLVQELIRLNEKAASNKQADSMHIGRIRAALLYVESHYKEEIKIEQLAEVCNMSVSYFRRLFVECMHIAPLEYVNSIRIQKACELLQKEDIPINTLAWKVGFASVSAFDRNFKKFVGETPKQWRLKGAKKKEYVTYQTKVLKGWVE